MVPTVDTVRYNFLVKALVLAHYPVLLTGPVGTGKTSVAQTVLRGLNERWAGLTVNMSSQVGLCTVFFVFLFFCSRNTTLVSDLIRLRSTSLSVSITVQTTSNNIQAIIENRLEKRTKGEFVPVGGKHLLCLLDDLNMPAHDLFGSQPPLELLRLWIDYGFWYDRRKQTKKFVKVRKGFDEGRSGTTFLPSYRVPLFF